MTWRGLRAATVVEVNKPRAAAFRHSLQGAVDWALALLGTGVGVADVVVHRLPGGLAASVVATLLLFLPLGLRRRFPLTVLACVGVGSLLLMLMIGNPGSQNGLGLEGFLAWLWVAYSTAAHTDGRRHLAALALAVGVIVTWAAASLVAGQAPGNVLPAVVLAALMWFIGRAIRRRQSLVRMLGERAEQLEREHAYQARAAVADERVRIARELHDVVAHSVSVMVVQAQAGQRLIGEPEQAAGAFRSIEGAGREALVELRRLLGILRTDDRELAIGPQPGLGSLPVLLEQVREAGLPVRLRVEGERVSLAPGVDLSAYRIVQEALTNTLKHAGRASAEIVVRYGSAAVELEIVDDGAGRSAFGNGSGHGMVGMRERVALYGGSLQAAPREGGGFRVHALLPLNGTAG